MTNASAWRLVAVLALASNAALATRSIAVERRMTHNLVRADSVRRDAEQFRRRSQTERAALVRTIAGMPVTAPFIEGVVAENARSIRLNAPEDGLYYLMSPECAACAMNLPFLDSLAAAGGVRVIAFARDAKAATLRQYALRHSSSITFVASPRGYIEQVTPRWATPVSIVVREGRVQSILPGRISDAEKRELLTQRDVARSDDVGKR